MMHRKTVEKRIKPSKWRKHQECKVLSFYPIALRWGTTLGHKSALVCRGDNGARHHQCILPLNRLLQIGFIVQGPQLSLSLSYFACLSWQLFLSK